MSDNRFAYCEGRSVELVNVLLTQKLESALAAGYKVDAIFLDCTNAFNRVDHEQLFNRLKSFGLPGMWLGLIGCYLRNRSQCVVVNGSKSQFVSETSGVPQGSIIGPQFFNCLVSTTPASVVESSELVQYANDFLLVRDKSDEKMLQLDLNALFRWAEENHLLFCPTKSVHLRFSRKRAQGVPAQYDLSGNTTLNEQQTNYLGLYSD